MRLHRHNQRNGNLISYSVVEYFRGGSSRPHKTTTDCQMECQRCGDFYQIQLDGDWDAALNIANKFAIVPKDKE